MSVFTLSTSGLLVAVGVALAGVAATRKLAVGHWLAVSLFAVYLVGVAHFALLPLVFDPRGAAEVGPIDLGRLIELRPFFLSSTNVMPASQVGLNILLTVPFGFGLPFVANIRGREVLAIGVLFSVGIELAQLIADALYLARPTWSVDINDVFPNSLGVALGLAAFHLVRFIYVQTVGRHHLRRGPWAHFHDTLMGSGG